MREREREREGVRATNRMLAKNNYLKTSKVPKLETYKLRNERTISKERRGKRAPQGRAGGTRRAA